MKKATFQISFDDLAAVLGLPPGSITDVISASWYRPESEDPELTALPIPGVDVRGGPIFKVTGIGPDVEEGEPAPMLSLIELLG